MADYIVPSVQVTQEFTQTPLLNEQPLSALIIGPQYKLSRYGVPAEKADTSLGVYDYTADTAYEWPNKPAGAIVDQDYVKVYLEKAEAKYFPHAGLASGASAVVTKIAIPNTSSYYSNRVKSGSLVFKTGNGHTRSEAFGGSTGRDVKIGDVIKISDGSTTLKSKVKALHPSVVAASITTPATNDSTNPATRSADITKSTEWAGSGSEPSGFGADIVNDSTAYFGYPELGIIEDTYTFEVTEGTSLSDVKFTVTSAAGAFAPKTNVVLTSPGGDEHVLILDNAANVFGNTNAVRVDFSTAAGVFNAGQKWTLNVKAAYTRVTNVATGGTYTGTKDIVYKLTVVRGGRFYTGSNASTCARVAITSNDVDSSATVNVADDTSFNVGTAGVTATFADATLQGGLRLGDVYYVTASAESKEEFNIIEFQADMPSDFYTAGTLTAQLFLVKDSVEIPEVRDLDGGIFNWETTANQITINQAIAVTDANLKVGSDYAELPVQAGNVYAQRRDLLVDNTNTINSVNSLAGVGAALGTVHPDNTLAQGVYEAVLNAANSPVYYVGVASDDLAGYNAALELAKKKDAYYNLVPLTFDTEVHTAVIGHVEAMRAPAAAKERMAFVSVPITTSKLIYDTNDGENWTATVSDDPRIDGTQYKLVTIAGATLLTDNVRAGDELLINFTTDPTGKVVYDVYTIDEIRTETTLSTVESFDAAISSAIKVQIRRPYSKQEQIDAFEKVAGDFDKRWVVSVFPDTFKSGAVEKNGYFLAAELAGQASGILPHQPQTNVELLGPTDLSKAVTEYTEDQLDQLAAAGIWIVTQSAVGATAYTRHQLTTDNSGVNFAEVSITRNVDSIAKSVRKALKPYVGKYNVNPGTIFKVRSVIDDVLRKHLLEVVSESAGPQLLAYEIISVDQHPTLKDRIQAKIKLTVPAPNNGTDVLLEV